MSTKSVLPGVPATRLTLPEKWAVSILVFLEGSKNPHSKNTPKPLKYTIGVCISECVCRWFSGLRGGPLGGPLFSLGVLGGPSERQLQEHPAIVVVFFSPWVFLGSPSERQVQEHPGGTTLAFN